MRHFSTMPKGLAVYGEEFRKIREERFLTLGEMAEKLGMSLGGVARIEGKFVTRVMPKTLRRLADLVGATPEGVKARVALTAEQLAAHGKESLGEKGEDAIDPADVQQLDEIPTFDLSVAAGEWADVLDVPEVCGHDQIAQGLFRVRISGDSMLPTYKTGMVIEFECLRDGGNILQAGRDYYVQRNDGAATFKRLQKIAEEELILRAINAKKYPKPMPVARTSITRMALARGQYIPFD